MRKGGGGKFYILCVYELSAYKLQLQDEILEGGIIRSLSGLL